MLPLSSKVWHSATDHFRRIWNSPEIGVKAAGAGATMLQYGDESRASWRSPTPLPSAAAFQAIEGQEDSVHEPATLWERANNTRWGRYLTDLERQNLICALRLAGSESARALEIGCGVGRWSRYLVESGLTPTCTDVDQDILAICKERVPEVTTALVSTSDERFPVEDDSVDFLLAYEVPMVTGAPWFPAEAARVLKSKGVIAFTAHNPLSLRAFAYRTLHRTGLRRRPGHFYQGPTYPQQRRSLRQHGFQFVREEGMAWLPFHRESDSRLVPPLTALEGAIGLRRLVPVSPWVVGTAKRT
jgi:ubiquinone/menaquinone biosynthesis C-methylase UbiE